MTLAPVTPAAPRVAVVLPGGGARGAYEVGAMSVLLPALEAAGERVTVWCGTSVGAINATALASLADAPVREQVGELESIWANLRKSDVIAPIAGRGGARMLAQMVGHALGLPGVALASLLDPSPLGASLEQWVDWGRLEANVQAGIAAAVCVVATHVAAGEPVAFVASQRKLPDRVDDELRYVRTTLRGEHVRASAAIPLLFPTVEVRAPRAAAGHYTDGGTRLNSPIKPAIDLGADRVIVVGLETFRRSHGPHPARAPGLADVAVNVLDGLLVDQVAHDIHRLAAINSFFVEDGRVGPLASARAYRVARGHEPYRPISYALVAPRRRGEIGRLAQAVFERRYGGWRALRDVDYALIARLLGARTRSRGEFLSFLLFDAEFTRALIELGRRDARRWLRRHPRIWCRDAAHDLSVGRIDSERLAEQHALDEFRAQRRH